MTPWTDPELKAERSYRYNERLGIQGIYGIPTREQHELAMTEANKIVEKLGLNREQEVFGF